MASNDNIGTLVIDTASTDNTVTGHFGNRWVVTPGDPASEVFDADGTPMAKRAMIVIVILGISNLAPGLRFVTFSRSTNALVDKLETLYHLIQGMSVQSHFLGARVINGVNYNG